MAEPNVEERKTVFEIGNARDELREAQHASLLGMHDEACRRMQNVVRIIERVLERGRK